MTAGAIEAAEGPHADLGTLVCEGSACAVVGAVTDAAVVLTAPVADPGWLDGLLRKQISGQFDQAGAHAAPGLLIKEDLDGV